jgi:hypothetical protein
MNCERAKELILSDAESGEKLEAHVASCKECRKLASAWASLKGIKPPDIGGPSRNLDFKIRGEAAAFLDTRKIHHKVFLRRIFMYATAACCVFVTWIGLDKIDHQGKTHRDNIASSSTIPWSNIDMEKDFFELTAELELSMESIYSSTNSDSTGSKEIEGSLPDLSSRKQMAAPISEIT